MVSAMSASAWSVNTGFIRTQRSRPPKSRFWSQPRTMGRVAALRSGVTASSRSRIRPSAGRVSALAIIFSFPPGTKWSERRIAQAERRRIMAARRQRITTSPCWFFARCSKITMPHCGRDFDSRFSTTSVSE